MNGAGAVLVYHYNGICAAAGWPRALAPVPEIATSRTPGELRYNGGWPPRRGKTSDGSGEVIHLLPMGPLSWQAGQRESGDSLVTSGIEKNNNTIQLSNK